MAWRSLHQTSGIKSYFCDTASPYQEGSVENANSRLRRYLPLETNLAIVEDATLFEMAPRMPELSPKRGPARLASPSLQIDILCFRNCRSPHIKLILQK